VYTVKFMVNTKLNNRLKQGIHIYVCCFHFHFARLDNSQSKAMTMR